MNEERFFDIQVKKSGWKKWLLNSWKNNFAFLFYKILFYKYYIKYYNIIIKILNIRIKYSLKAIWFLTIEPLLLIMNGRATKARAALIWSEKILNMSEQEYNIIYIYLAGENMRRILRYGLAMAWKRLNFIANRPILSNNGAYF